MPPKVGLWCLVHVFTALLPPKTDNDQDEFYEILSLSRDATPEQIRSAYKKLSLKLHPDKVAQRRGNVEEAKHQYTKVQEAYHVLINPDKRQEYHALGCSPNRYRFVQQGALANPGALYQHLTSASLVDKTRLVGVCLIMVLLLLLQPVLMAAKLNQSLAQAGGPLQDSSWTAILVPTWMLGALVLMFVASLVVAVTPWTAKIPVFLLLLEYMSWYAGAILLAQQWDDQDRRSYALTLTPVYVAMSLRWLQKVWLLRQIRHDLQRMVTPDYLESQVLHNQSLEELSPEQQETLRQTYLVVTVPPEFEVVDAETPQEAEEQKVQASLEFGAASELYGGIFQQLIGGCLFGSLFLLTLTLKLEDVIVANWWAVFSPIWIWYALQFCYACGICLFGGVVVLVANDDDEEEEEADDEDDDLGEENSIVEEEDEETGKSKNKSNTAKENKAAPITKKKADAEAATEKIAQTKDAADKPADAKKTKAKKKTNTTEEGVDDPKTNTDKKTKVSAPQASNAVSNADDCKPESAAAAATETEESKGNDDDDDSTNIHIDEETFRAWQTAYAEAEKSAMEAQAKAAGDCCFLTFKLMMLCLVVAKIDAAYDSEDPNDVGFNTFWILFPFFLFFGVVFVCCACMIYGASPGSAADFHDAVTDAGVANDEENQGDKPADVEGAPIVIPAPPSEPEPVPEEASIPAETEQPEPAQEDVKQEDKFDDMADLD